MSHRLFESATIIGVGLLGASLGMALKRRGLAARVVGVGRPGSESLRIAQERGAIDAGAETAAEGVKGADLVVLCTPVRSFPALMESIAPSLKPGVIVTDVGSTKGDVMKWAQEHLPKGTLFVGSHPMAGSEKSGPAAAKEDLYEAGVCMITAGTGGQAPAEKIGKMWEGVGMRTMFMSAQQHDAWVAMVSHLPHAVAGCLVQATDALPESRQCAAGGFMDSTRIASGDVDMWTDIFMTNRPAIIEALGEFQKALSHFKAAIIAGDEKAIREHFAAAKTKRDEIVRERESRRRRKPGGGG